VPFSSGRPNGKDEDIVTGVRSCEGLRMPAVGDRSHTQGRPASANLQCTKSRNAEQPTAAGSMAI
jgi:hypothetical protein